MAIPSRSKQFRLWLLLLLCATTLRALPSAAPATVPDEAPAAQTTSLHQWGAVTLFHGLPSDSVRAIAQDADGVMWFGTDAGLARYDGRRIQTVSGEGLASRRVLALAFDEAGLLWTGTDDGALVRLRTGEFRAIAETKGKRVTAIIAPSRGRALMTTDDGLVFDCRLGDDADKPRAQTLTDQITRTPSSSAHDPQPLALTSIALVGDTVLVGTHRRVLLSIERGKATEVGGLPRAFFVRTLARDERGTLFLGAQTNPADSGLYQAESDAAPLRPTKVAGGATGTVTALAFDRRNGDMLVGTDAEGVFRYRGSERLEQYTFEGTAGGLRSNRIYSIYVDHEGVAWLGTNRGVCRYDPHGIRLEVISSAPENNFVRALYQTRDGRLLSGTNRGLFVRDTLPASWQQVESFNGKTIYALAEDPQTGQVLIGAASGLYIGLPPVTKKKRPAETPPMPAEQFFPEDEESENVGEDEPTTSPTPEPAVAGSVRAIAVMGGHIYVATFGRGVERLDEARRRTLIWPAGNQEEAGAREVVSLYADEASGRLWIGTANNGIFYFDGEHVRPEPALEQLARNTIWSISGASRGEDSWLWIATNRGLYAYRQGRVLFEIAPNTDARSVVAISKTPDANDASATGDAADASSTQPAPRTSAPQAWCATAGGGVLKITIDEQFGAVTARLDTEQGLPSQNAFVVLPLEPDEKLARPAALLIGTSRGLARYEPGSTSPTLKLTRVTASRTYQPEELEAEPLRLEYPQDSLVVDMAAASSRTFPEQFQYGFLLYDAQGRVIKRKLSHDSQFQVEALKPGSYRVLARVYTIDLIASAPVEFNFAIARAPFPWTTLLLSILLALAVVALIWAVWQHRKLVRAGAALMDANRQLAAARLQLANEAEQERRRIARDLHDQTLADLRRLLLLTDAMQANGSTHFVGPEGTLREVGAVSVAGDGPAVLRAEIESISQEIRRICEDLSPSVLENVGFVAALEWALTTALAHMPPDERFAYDFVCDENLEERLHLSHGEQMQIYRIVQEAVSNVCRHAGAALVRLSVTVSDAGALVVTLEDDGRGYDWTNKPARMGRGLANIRARASLIEAEVRWTKREPHGTTFTMKKPLK